MDVCSVVDLYTCLLCSDRVVPFVRDFASYPFGRKFECMNMYVISNAYTKLDQFCDTHPSISLSTIALLVYYVQGCLYNQTI